MKQKSIIQLTRELNYALEKVSESYLHYLDSIKNARKLAKELEDVSKAFLDKPHVEIGDFEIDS